MPTAVRAVPWQWVSMAPDRKAGSDAGRAHAHATPSAVACYDDRRVATGRKHLFIPVRPGQGLASTQRAPLPQTLDAVSQLRRAAGAAGSCLLLPDAATFVSCHLIFGACMTGAVLTKEEAKYYLLAHDNNVEAACAAALVGACLCVCVGRRLGPGLVAVCGMCPRARTFVCVSLSDSASVRARVVCVGLLVCCCVPVTGQGSACAQADWFD